jgi:hypothetical protein
MRRAALLCAIFLALFSASLAHAQPARQPAGQPTIKLLIAQFSRLAFDSEYGGAHRRDHIIRWEGPIRVAIRGFGSARYRGEVRQHLRRLALLTGKDIRLLDWSSALAGPNIEIIFVSGGGGRLDPRAPCSTLLYDRHFVIYRAEIRIAPAEAQQRRHCLAEELTQAMGLANDSRLLRRSIFNDNSAVLRLALWDALMVRVLYDPSIRPGMSRYEALPIARTLIARLVVQHRESRRR